MSKIEINSYNVKDNTVIIIPVYEPEPQLLPTIHKLVENNFQYIVVVNDGSSHEYEAIFREAESIRGCTVLTHQKNQGKGAAIKTAISYVLNELPKDAGIITVDGDGQHKIEDIIRMKEHLAIHQQVVLGVRDFSGKQIPLRSKFGNQCTSFVFRVFLGMKIKDTQTGLRGFPHQILKDLLAVEGNRYEYETNILIYLQRERIVYHQINIQTVYIEENKSSHFRVIQDSLKIYGIVLKYIFSSLSASLLDELLFYIFKLCMGSGSFLLPSTVIAAILARVFSAGYNYWMNASRVFHGKMEGKTLVRYGVLAILQITISSGLVLSVEKMFRITSPEIITMIKIIIDVLLFFLSFRIQYIWVFHTERKEKSEKTQN